MSIAETPSAIDVEKLCAQVRPTIERVLRAKFRFGRSSFETKDSADCEDLVGDACLAFQQKLQDGEVPEHPEAYAAKIAHTKFCKYLRKKHPARGALRAGICTTLSQDPRLSRWERDRDLIGGRSAWLGRSVVMNRHSRLALESPVEASVRCYSAAVVSSGVRTRQDPATLLMPDLLLRFYDWLGGPFGVDPTVEFVFHASGKQEFTVDVESDETSERRSYDPSPDDMERARGIAEFVWHQVTSEDGLGSDHVRCGLFLLFDPPKQEQVSVLEVLLLHEVCTLNAIAEACGLSLDQIAQLRRGRVTLEVLMQLYGLTRQQAQGKKDAVMQLMERRLKSNGFWGGQSK